MRVNNLGRWILGILGVVILTALFILLAINVYNSLKTQPLDEAWDVVKIHVKETGLHEVSLKELQGFNQSLESLSAESLHLSLDGKTVPYLLDGESLYFYGITPDSRYAPYSPYILSFFKPGVLMDTLPVSEFGGYPADTISETIHLEENNQYDSRSIQQDDQDLRDFDPWYWTTIQNDDEISLEFGLADIDGDSSAVLRTALFGATSIGSIDPDHDVDLYLNGSLVDTVTWDGEARFIASSVIEPGVLHPGTNTLLIDNHVQDRIAEDGSENSSDARSPLDIIRFDWVEIEYAGMLQAVEDQVLLDAASGDFSVGGFSDEPKLIDVTDSAQPSVTEGWRFDDGKLEFSIAGDSILLAAGPQGTIENVEITPVRDAMWRDDSIHADLIILSTDELSPSLSPLVEWREEQGLSVVLVSVEDVFNEFGAGENSPESIAKFIEFALTEWDEPKPSYVLLVGEASYDYKDYLGQLGQNVIPAPMVHVEFGGETVSDTRLADPDHDGMPEVAIGRWPVETTSQVDALVKRTIAYEQGTAKANVLLAADGTSEEFISLSEEVLAGSGLPEATVERLYGVPVDQFIEAWNSGAWLVSYAGHGSIDRWGKENVLSSDAVADLKTDGSPPIVLQLTCLTGFYAHPTVDSISEIMLRANEGPVEIIAATSLTLSSSQRPFGVYLIKALQDRNINRIGDAMQQAKLALDVTRNHELAEISETFTLLGDPSALIIRPN